MALKYTKHTETFCRFKGDELKTAMEQQGLTAYMLAKALHIYPGKVQHWEKQIWVTVDAEMMADINSAIDCVSIKKVL